MFAFLKENLDTPFEAGSYLVDFAASYFVAGARPYCIERVASAAIRQFEISVKLSAQRAHIYHRAMRRTATGFGQ